MNTDRIAALLLRFPAELPAGPCAFCGGPYAAHRIIDAIEGRVIAGDSPAAVAKDMEIEEEMVRWIVGMDEDKIWLLVDMLMTSCRVDARLAPAYENGWNEAIDWVIKKAKEIVGEEVFEDVKRTY